MLRNTNNNGFTLVELIVTISLIGIISVSLMGIITNYLTTVTRNNLSVEMTSASQNLLRATVEQLRHGAGVRQTNTIPDTNGPGGGWNTANTTFVIIIAVPTLDGNGDFIINSLTGEPYANELVYFRQGNTLFRRTLADTTAVGNRLVTSCPAAIATPSCPADIKLIDHLQSMTFSLFDQDNASTTDPLAADSVLINLNLSRDTFGTPLQISNSIRVTLRNNF